MPATLFVTTPRIRPKTAFSAVDVLRRGESLFNLTDTVGHGIAA
jgi:hypothetical protein